MDKILERDLSLKILSVLLAVILWFQVVSQQNPERQVTIKNVPVSYVKVDSSLVIMDKKPDVIEVQIKGYKRFVDTVTAADIKATVDLSGASTGKDLYPIEVTISKDKVEFVEASPAQATVRFENLVTKSVPVEVVASNLDPDFASSQVTVRPSAISVSGPASVVQRVARMVAEVDLRGATATVQQQVQVRPVDADGNEVKNVSFTKAPVDVSVPILKLPPAKSVQVTLPSVVGSPAKGFRVGTVTVEPSSVTIRGLPALIEDITSVTAQAVDVTGASANVIKEVAVVAPQGVEMVEPRSIQVTVTIVPETGATKTLEVPVKVVNGAANLKYALEASTVKVTVNGLASDIDNLRADSIDASVDVTGLAAGHYQQNVTVRVPAGIQVSSTDPANVGVTVSGP